MIRCFKKYVFILVLILQAASVSACPEIIFCGNENNDLYRTMLNQGLNIILSDNVNDALMSAGKESGLIISAEGYPEDRTEISGTIYETVREKKIRKYMKRFARRKYGCSSNILHLFLDMTCRMSVITANWNGPSSLLTCSGTACRQWLS